MTVIPEAWQNHATMDEKLRDYYQYFSSIMEPWDGPALVTFCDGKSLGAILDRNGLRPCRYYITNDDLLILGSEVGTLDVKPENIRVRGRVSPGKVFLVDFGSKRIVTDEELKKQVVNEFPYSDWLRENKVVLPRNEFSTEEAFAAGNDSRPIRIMSDARLKMFGYTVEHIEILLKPLCVHGVEPLGSMGNDSALAVMSSQPRLLYSYFKQLFAQVTNPAIDSIRESIVMSLTSFIGPQENMLTIQPKHCHRLFLEHPFLTIPQCDDLKNIHEWYPAWKSKVIDITFSVSDSTLHEGILAVCDACEKAVNEGFQFLILSDKGISPERAPIGYATVLPNTTI